MSDKPSYLAAAFNARPLGMRVPPNWFGLAAFGLLGAFVNPALWLVGAGLEGIYLWAMSRNPRFRATVDATSRERPSWDARYEALSTRLDEPARQAQEKIEREATELVELLQRTNALQTQIAGVTQMGWLHLKLLAARSGLSEVVAAAQRERANLDEQERHITARLAAGGSDAELTRSLEQQLAVIKSRRVAHADAERRCELVDAELERLRQHIALVREQALLATDEDSVAQSLDALTASLSEADRWVRDQRELFAGLDDLTDEPPPAELLRPRARTRRKQSTGEST